jgi:hypothetical protein
VEQLSTASADDERMAGHLWAEISVDALRQSLRLIWSKRDDAKQRAQRARQRIVEDWDWSVVLPMWANEFLRVLA